MIPSCCCVFFRVSSFLRAFLSFILFCYQKPNHILKEIYVIYLYLLDNLSTSGITMKSQTRRVIARPCVLMFFTYIILLCVYVITAASSAVSGLQAGATSPSTAVFGSARRSAGRSAEALIE